ncbi:MAG: ATP-grasp domain-containing protein [Planctomycetota bacterium]|jgi:biotin carboxylase|nr:ATP-grasp domain-containing protein [Planctomycetota bacterium]
MNRQKRILILGGTPFQIPVIRYAKLRGYYVITCDYLPDNPGHRLADEYHNVSTTDVDAVLRLSRRLGIDGILAYASDPAAPTAAYVGNELGLHSNPLQAVRILAQKDLFREFLIAHGFNSPRAVSFSPEVDGLSRCRTLEFPVMVKPVDSSGSKGVCRVSTPKGIVDATERALQHSRVKRVIVEEYVARHGPQIGGEAFVQGGEVVLLCLGDQMVDAKCSPYVPTGMLFPSVCSPDTYACIRNELQRLLGLLRYSFGALNLEIALDAKGRIHLMEVGPRSGGNFLPELVGYATGTDIARCSVEAALGHRVCWPGDTRLLHHCGGAYAYYAVHSRCSGRLKALQYREDLQSRILEIHTFKQPGDRVEAYHGANCTIGIMLLRFATRGQMQNVMYSMQDYVNVEVASDGIGLGRKTCMTSLGQHGWYHMTSRPTSDSG